MPTYRFQCEGCGLNFTARAASNAPSAPCGGCGAAAPRDLPRTVNTGHAVSSGETSATPGATGYAGVDYSYDRAIGDDARAKWAMIAQRQRDKISYLESTGATGHDLSRTPDGSYRVMAPPEKASKTATRTAAFEKLAEESKAKQASPQPRPTGSGR